MNKKTLEGKQLNAGDRVPCKDPVCRIGTCVHQIAAQAGKAAGAISTRAFLDAVEATRECPNCGHDRRAVTSRNPSTAWVCDYCSTEE